MNKTVKTPLRIVTFILALIITVSALAVLAYAAGTTGAPNFRITSVPVFKRGNNKVSTVKSAYTYTVEVTVVDMATKWSTEDLAKLPNNDDDDSDDPSLEPGSLITVNGGNFTSYSTATVQKARQVNGYIAFDVKIPNVVFDGLGKTLTLDIVYEYDHDGAGPEEPVTYYGSVSTTVTNAVIDEPEVEEPEDEKEDDSYLVATPNIIVSSYGYGDGGLLAGSEFPFTVTFKNTSKDIDLENIIMEIETGADITPTSSSNSVYIDKLAKNSSMTKVINMQVKASAAPGPQTINVNFSYEYVQNKARKSGARSERLAVPIEQTIRFELGELQVPPQLWPGDRSQVYIDLFNKGKNEIYNITATMSGNMEGGGETRFVGNLAPGSSTYLDFWLTGYTPGDINGTVTITYEDSSGKTYEEVREFVTSVMYIEEPPVDPGFPTDPGIEEIPKSPLPMIAAIAGGLLVAGVMATMIIFRAKAKREEAEDEVI